MKTSAVIFGVLTFVLSAGAFAGVEKYSCDTTQGLTYPSGAAQAICVSLYPEYDQIRVGLLGECGDVQWGEDYASMFMSADQYRTTYGTRGFNQLASLGVLNGLIADSKTNELFVSNNGSYYRFEKGVSLAKLPAQVSVDIVNPRDNDVSNFACKRVVR